MNGFLYKLYADKWNPLKYIFWFRLLLLATYVILLSCIASPSIVLVGTLWGTGASPRFMRPMVIVEIVLMVPVALLEIVETSIDFFYNEDSVALKARLRLWGRGKRALIKFIDRGGHLVLSSVSLVLTGCSVSSSSHLFIHWHLLCSQISLAIAGCIGLLTILHQDCGTVAEHVHCNEDPIRPGWVRMCLAVGVLLGWIVLLFEGCKPFRQLSTFVNIVSAVMVADVGQFLKIFVPLLIGFTTSMSAIAYHLPEWASRWGSWWLVCENLMLLSFIQVRITARSFLPRLPQLLPHSIPLRSGSTL